jgi:hypothetical protein
MYLKIKNKTTNAPTDKGYTEIYSNAFAFTAVKPDGSIRTLPGASNLMFVLGLGATWKSC